MYDLIPLVKNFLVKNLCDSRPLLLAYSGGVDSVVLLDLLRRCNLLLSGQLHLVHVDHRWRTESSKQAQQLKKQAKSWGIPFHLFTSPSPEKDEEKARQERLEFFFKIYQEIHSQAVLLAHHADDQAETVLKRLFEGASLTHLGGMRSVVKYEKMILWRPLLSIPKKQLMLWAKDKNLTYIEDATNFDKKYLRARMRTELLPKLSEMFGKEVTMPLNRLGKMVLAIEDYLEKKTASYFETMISGPFGLMWDLNPYLPMEKVELEFILRQFLQKNHLEASYIMIETLMQAIEKKKANCQMRFGKNELFLDRGRIFWITKPLPPKWKVIVSNSKPINYQPPSWIDVWKGKATLGLPSSEYTLIPPENPSMSQWWSKHKVPNFIRKICPLVSQEGGAIFEFLSGQDIKKNCKLQAFVTIEIKSRD